MIKDRVLHLVYIMIVFLIISCTEDFENINTDPNNPTKVKTSFLMTNAQKGLMDDMYDEWFGGRQGYAYAQFFAQRDYNEEDRYQLRQETNNTYWILIYGDIMDLVEIIRLNTEAGEAGSQNEIAAARILKAWAMQILTDTYGDIPYFDAFQAEKNVSPAYTPQSEIYADLIKELTEAAAQLDLSKPVFGEGDIIYNGDAAKWKRFANSLKMRVAIRMSNVDPNYKTYIQNAISDGVFESNADNALFRFLNEPPNAAPLYDAYYVSNRNDFSLSKPFVDLLSGRNDELNSKTNPFEGLFDPRLSVFAVANESGEFVGMPYGIPRELTSTARPGTIDFTKGGLVTARNLALPYMDYAEVCFIRSEVENWSQEWYEKGVAASIEHWAWEAGLTGTLPPNYNDLANAYIAALPPATPETVATQKYIALFMQGYEAWAEYRRTGFPSTLVRPGQIAYEMADGTPVVFEALEGDDIPRRITYPVIEQSLNPEGYQTAADRIGGDDLGVAVWWDE